MKRGFLLEQKGGRKPSVSTTTAAETSERNVSSKGASSSSDDQPQKGKAGSTPAATTCVINSNDELAKRSDKPTMKRGFLLDKNAPRKTTTPAVKVKVPSVKIKENMFTGVITFPANLTHMHLVQIPPSDLNKDALDVGSICMLYMGMKEAILALPGFPQPPQLTMHMQYLIKPVEGAGQGLFANRAFGAGDLILAERPALVQPHALPMHKDEGPGLMHQNLELLVSTMWWKHRDEFRALHNCKPVTPDYPAIRGVIDTNSLALGRFPGWDGLMAGVCTQISRVNHSCAPNAAVRWNMLSFQEELRALRPIAPGEQVFIAYVGLLRPRAQRRKELKRMYAFECACAACSGAADVVKRSDARRRLLAAFVDRCAPGDEGELRAWVADRGMGEDAVIGPALRVVGMMREENLLEDQVAGPQYERLVKAYCALGNEAEARKWAREAAVLSKAYEGDDGGWGKIADDPRNTDWWGIRVSSS